MRRATALVAALLATSSTTATKSCVELQGIAPGNESVLDLDVLLRNDTLGHPLAPINIFTNPFVGTVAQCAGELETPVSMRLLLGIDSSVFTIANMFEPNGLALDVFGDRETSDSRRRCQPADGDEDGQQLFKMHLTVAVVYAVSHVASEYMPWCSDVVAPLLEALGTPLSLVNIAEGDPEPSTDTPWGLAKAYVDEIMSFLMENDGWNADGSLGGKEFNRIPFTGDFHYEDSAGNEWNGYKPKNTPYEFKRTKKWQPLLESNGLGYITTQEHVTPHIGITARFMGFHTVDDEEAWGSRKLDKPPYRHRHDEIAREVLEASKMAADDPVKQFAINFFDDKFNSLVPLKITYFLERGDSLSLIDFLRITFTSQLGLYNAVLLAWREKIRHDAPRPPSVVREQLGNERVEAYAGPDVGVTSIKASEWEPYIRTMPHSEYPSASSCMCEAFASALKVWAGADEIDPPLEFPPPEFGGPVLTFTSWSEMSQMCGDSRVWAGLHFEGAVPAGVDLCGGDEMAISIAASVDALNAGDASGAIFKRDLGELMLRPL
eukprot:g6624.t1